MPYNILQFQMHLRISQLGTMAGTLASTATYSTLVAAGTMAGLMTSSALDTTGFILGKGAGHFLGFGAEIAVSSACRLLGRGAAATTTTYGPLVAGAAAAVVGLTTGLAVSGGEYLVNSAIKKIHEKYRESQQEVALLDDEPVIVDAEEAAEPPKEIGDN